MQKGYKRSGKGMAVLRFFIGLIVIAILVCVAYFFLAKVDYTDKLANPDASMRPYVEMTANPGAVSHADEPVIEAAPVVESKPVVESQPAVEATDIPAADENTADYVDVSVTQAPTATPTSVPTPTPTAQPTAIPTPEVYVPIADSVG